MAVELTTVVKRIDDALTADVDKEIVILNPSGDSYIGLDDIGRRIWEMLAEPWSVADLCARLGREYAGEPEQIRGDVSRFLDQLVSEGLVLVVSAHSQ